MSNAFVLGLDHTIQYEDDGGRLADIISALCEEHYCDLIAEEWNTTTYASQETVGKKVAASLGINWLSMKMPETCKEDLGILPALKLRYASFNEWSGPLPPQIPGTTYFPRADRIREEYWLNKILIASPKSVLATCGLIHVGPFAKRMKDAGFFVDKASLCEHVWYRNTPNSKCAEVEMNNKDDRY
jgi:hypothetical protein